MGMGVRVLEEKNDGRRVWMLVGRRKVGMG